MLFVLYVKQYYRLLDFRLVDQVVKSMIKYLIFQHSCPQLLETFINTNYLPQELYLWSKLVYMMNDHKILAETFRAGIYCFLHRSGVKCGVKVPTLISSAKEARGIEWQP